MALERISVSFEPGDTTSEGANMEAEGPTGAHGGIETAVRRSRLGRMDYVQDVSPEALAMEGEGPAALVEPSMIRRASVAVRGLSVTWRIDRAMGAAIGRGVLEEAIPGAKSAANKVAELNGPRIPGVNGNSKV